MGGEAFVAEEGEEGAEAAEVCGWRGWVGGWVEEKQVVRLLCASQEGGWVGGWVGYLPLRLSVSSGGRRDHTLSRAFPSLAASSTILMRERVFSSSSLFFSCLFLGGWVGGWLTEEQAVRMRCCELGLGGWVGGWVGG